MRAWQRRKEREHPRLPVLGFRSYTDCYRYKGETFLMLFIIPLQLSDAYSLIYTFRTRSSGRANTIRSVRDPSASGETHARVWLSPPSHVAVSSDAPPRVIIIHGGCILSLCIVIDAVYSPFNGFFLSEESELNDFGDPEKS